MDSCVCAALAARDTDAAALHISYGQRTEHRERQAFERICDRLHIERRLALNNEALAIIGGSALTDRQIAVPEAREEIGRGRLPVTYVPFRNAHFLSTAVSWAEVSGAARIYIGAVAQDSSGYPDCRPSYYQAFNELVRQGTRDGNIQIVTPLINLSKTEVVKLGLELNAPLELTWSCYSREDRACGICESCVLRMRAFAEAGAPDPVLYMEQLFRNQVQAGGK
jgi:7-cyano-7-deazaguanine synthase